jgi:hypothetical protein
MDNIVLMRCGAKKNRVGAEGWLELDWEQRLFLPSLSLAVDDI